MVVLKDDSIKNSNGSTDKIDAIQKNEYKFSRDSVKYADLTSRFVKEENNFTKQFASLYVKRIEELSLVLKEAIEKKWGSNVNLIPLSELEEQDGKKCAIIGTLYKHQSNKPSILQELSEEHQMSLPEPKEDYCSDDDQLFLEDQTSRIKLTGSNVTIKESVTGVVCAVLGRENEKSTFEVEDWCFPGCPPSVAISSVSASAGKKVVFLSGLELASLSQNLSLNLLTEWLGGLAGSIEVQQDGASIVRVIIAGNSIKGCADQHLSKGHLSGKAEDKAAAADMTKGTQKLDSFLENIGSNCCVTIMPGQYDLTTLMMPQRPMHPTSFPKAKRFKSIKGVSNPWVGKISDRIIIGTSGQPIQDIQKVCGLKTLPSIEWLQKTLEWRHICPTAPDTIPCMPFCKNDPFIIKECPDIYFAGNMDIFETKMHQRSNGQNIRLICIPKFATTQTAVLLDLETLDAVPISFGSQ